VSWHFIQEDIILFYTHVPIVAEEFIINYEQEQEEAVFDPDAVRMLEAFEWMDYVGVREDMSPIGELILPSIDVSLPIFLGVGEPNITLGAGTVVADIVMGEGNYVLASHWNPNPGILFGGLDLIQVGDPLLLRDANYLYVYETIIGDNHIIEPYRWDITEYVEGKTYLTLFTCTPDGFRRVKVRGELVERVSIAELSELIERVEAHNSAVEEAERLEALMPAFEAEVIIQIVEHIHDSTPSFPIMEVGIAVGVSILLSVAVVLFSSVGFKRR